MFEKSIFVTFEHLKLLSIEFSDLIHSLINELDHVKLIECNGGILKVVHDARYERRGHIDTSLFDLLLLTSFFSRCVAMASMVSAPFSGTAYPTLRSSISTATVT